MRISQRWGWFLSEMNQCLVQIRTLSITGLIGVCFYLLLTPSSEWNLWLLPCTLLFTAILYHSWKGVVFANRGD